MPDQSDVETALATAASEALYPNGTTFDSALGVLCRIYRGSPTGAALNNDLAAGRVNVTVAPVDGSYRNTTRHLPTFLNDAAPATLAVGTVGNTIAFTGTADAGQLAGVMVDSSSYVYRTNAGDLSLIHI